MRKLITVALVGILALALAGIRTHAAAQQTGAVQGTVLDATTGRPLGGAQVVIEGTQIGMLTNPQGQFLIPGAPGGRQSVRVEMIGFGTERATVMIEPGRTANLVFRLTTTAVKLEEIVVTGVAGATPKTKLAFTVDKLAAEAMPVPALSAASMVQGKVAGAQVVMGVGRPGAAPSILLRGPKSINSSGRQQDPLYIVDGVIMGSAIGDIPASDIESIEVVKGAAAASMYGSRAANGIVQITTRRGAMGGADETRYTIRTEYGQSDMAGKITTAQKHRYIMNADGTKFIAETDNCKAAGIVAGTCQGREFDWLDGGNGTRLQPVTTGNAWKNFQDKEWPGGTYDNLERFFDPGAFLTNYFSVQGRSGGTRYHFSINNRQEDGVLYGQPGLKQNTLRLNLDQGLMDNLQASVSTYYSRGKEGVLGGGGQGGIFFDLTRMPAGVDLLARDENGELIIKPDQTTENENPVYELLNRKTEGTRERFTGGATLRYTPLHWLDLDANFSYDRSNYAEDDYRKKGYMTARPSTVNDGYYYEYARRAEALNGSATLTLRHSFTDRIHNRTQLRYLMEQSNSRYVSGYGYNFAAADVPTLVNTRDSRTPSSSRQEIKFEGFFVISAFDIMDRYMVDGLIRRDGSSLFGEEERWQMYYRGSVAWRMSEEPFWSGLKNLLPEAKLRYSYGTAGGLPAFAAQYETYSIGSGGTLTPVSLGNKQLRPEYAVEQEMGVDFTTLGGATATITYATSTIDDQILRVPLAGYTGFREQWKNAGTLESNTWEASLDLPWLTRDKVRWSSRVLFDRTRQEITAMDVPPFQYGQGSVQGLESVFYARPGEAVGTIYGNRWASRCSDLHKDVQNLCASEFQVNDDGYLVWVGSGNTWRDGIKKNLWGTTGPTIPNVGQVYWGTPIKAQDEKGELFLPLGRTMPDYTLGMSNTFSFKNLTVYALVDAVQGFHVYNLARHWAYFENYHHDQDQVATDETKKPEGYYGSSGLYGVLSPPNSRFVEDGSFVKLREVSLRYQFTADQLSKIGLLQGIDGISISLIGRNLKTWTDYRGYDPEVGFGGGDTGSAAISRLEGFQYPNFRTITAAVEVNF